MTLTVGSLFSGIGGLDLGLERAGMEVIWQSEIDPYGCRVLEKHWPEVVNHGNIKDINWRDVVRPDVICGGYPCQPFSTAGKRQGTDDPRHLWPWVREAIVELRPRYAILENVRGHITLGLSTVLGELAGIGYDAEWQIVSANSVGAPHRRDRVLIVAYPVGELANTDDSGRLHGQLEVFTADRWLNALRLIGTGRSDVAHTDSSHSSDGGQRESIPSQDSSGRDDGSGSGSDTWQVSMGSTRQDPGDVANTDDNGSSSTTLGGSVRTPTDEQSSRQDNSTDTQGRSGISREMANTESRDSSRTQDVANTNGTPGQQQQERTVREPNTRGRSWWQVEPDVGRVAHGIPSRVDRLRGLGNAVVPQVAELVGRMVVAHYEETL